jgi:FHS family L-fucose permease-like MFS transporter
MKKQSILSDGKGGTYIFPFILITSLFFLWAFTHGLLDVLNKQFQDLLQISKARSGMLQMAFYGAYFFMAIPSGLLMHKYGYKRGIIMGLFLFAFGAYLFYPAVHVKEFGFFLFALFIIACGLTFLETAANPYSTILGPKETASSRINLSHTFNGLGWMLGPLIGGMIIFSVSDNENPFYSLSIPYLGLGTLVLLVIVLFKFVKLPEIDPASVQDINAKEVEISFFKRRHFIWSVVAQFFYVAAQTGIFSFFINYYLETIYPDNATSDKLAELKEEASRMLSFGGMSLLIVGRFSGSFIMRRVRPNRVLAIYAAINVILMVLVMLGLNWISVFSLFFSFFFMSIMFPTIFALGLQELGPETKKASSYLVMAVAGGAVCPLLMGYIADISYMAIGFIVPLICFVIIFIFGCWTYKVKQV